LPTATSIKEALSKPTIKQLAKDNDPTTIVLAIAHLSNKYLQAFNVSQSMTADQIMLFAEDFYETYYTDTLDDLKLMFSMVRRGEIGKIYNRIDGLIVFEWYREYLEKKYEAREREMQNDKKNHNNALSGLSKHDKIQSIVDRYKPQVKRVVEVDSEPAFTFSGWVEGLKDLPEETLQEQLRHFKDRSSTNGAYGDHIEALENELSSR